MYVNTRDGAGYSRQRARRRRPHPSRALPRKESQQVAKAALATPETVAGSVSGVGRRAATQLPAGVGGMLAGLCGVACRHWKRHCHLECIIEAGIQLCAGCCCKPHHDTPALKADFLRNPIRLAVHDTAHLDFERGRGILNIAIRAGKSPPGWNSHGKY